MSTRVLPNAHSCNGLLQIICVLEIISSFIKRPKVPLETTGQDMADIHLATAGYAQAGIVTLHMPTQAAIIKNPYPENHAGIKLLTMPQKTALFLQSCC